MSAHQIIRSDGLQERVPHERPLRDRLERLSERRIEAYAYRVGSDGFADRVDQTGGTYKHDDTGQWVWWSE